MPMTQVTTLTQESIENFRSWLFARGKSALTAKAYSTDLRVLLMELETDEITAEEYEDTAANWLTANKRKVSPKTTSRRLTSVRQFAKWAKWGDVLGDYTLPIAAKSQPHPLPEGIDGVRRMIAVARRDEHKALIALCGLMGLRIQEALDVNPKDFYIADTGERWLTVRGKGDKSRRVPVSPEAWDALVVPVTRAFVNNESTVIGLKDRFARSLCTSLGKRAGLRRPVASHDLRSTFATEVYNNTQDQRLVQELLGHANGSTTEGYIGVSFDKMVKGVQL